MWEYSIILHLSEAKIMVSLEHRYSVQGDCELEASFRSFYKNHTAYEPLFMSYIFKSVWKWGERDRLKEVNHL